MRVCEGGRVHVERPSLRTHQSWHSDAPAFPAILPLAQDKHDELAPVENVPAPQLAIDYYDMDGDARLTDLIVRVRADEQHHSEVNHSYAASTSPRPVSKSEVVELAEN